MVDGVQDQQTTEKVEKRTFFFLMVLVPTKGWTRVGNAYRSKEVASSWIDFVSACWHGLRTRVSKCTLTWRNGKLDDRSRRILDKKYNMDS